MCIATVSLIDGCARSPSAPSSSVVDPRTTGTLNLTFTPEATGFTEAAEIYRLLWAEEGARITGVMEQDTRLTFVGRTIPVVVFEGPSSSGNRNVPMYLRASYTQDEKKAALVHELGHRLIAQLTVRPSGLDEHRVLDLFLYDVWEVLWGKAFADQQVAVESGRRGLYDYETAWRWALSLSPSERALRFAEIVRSNRL